MMSSTLTRANRNVSLSSANLNRTEELGIVLNRSSRVDIWSPFPGVPATGLEPPIADRSRRIETGPGTSCQKITTSKLLSSSWFNRFILPNGVQTIFLRADGNGTVPGTMKFIEMRNFGESQSTTLCRMTSRRSRRFIQGFSWSFRAHPRCKLV